MSAKVFFLITCFTRYYFFRADLEELQCLWAEVRKELNKLEEHLSYRLSSVLSGNDNFSPLSAMEIVSSVS